jgi:integrase/recombinase XerD
MAGGEIMLTQSVESYIAVRRATGFAVRSEGSLLQSFAVFSDAAGKRYVKLALKPPSSGLDPRRRSVNERAVLDR